MSFLPIKTLSIGVEITPSSVKLAALRLYKQKWEVHQLKEYPLPLKDQDVKELDKLANEGSVISAIDSREVLIRPLDIRLKNEKDVAEALDFQVEPSLPYPIDKGIVDYHIIEKLASGTRICFSAVRKDHLEHHLETLNNLPEKVTSAPSALATLATFVGGGDEPKLILHVAKQSSTLIATKKGKLLTSFSLPYGSNSHDKEVFKLGLLKLIGSAESALGEEKLTSLLFVGEDTSLANSIQKVSKKTVVIPTYSPIDLSVEKLQKYSIALGTALHPFFGKGIDFRKKEFVYPKIFKHVKKSLLTFFTLTTLLSVTLFFAGRAALHNQKNAYIQSGLSFLSSEGRPCHEDELTDVLLSYEKEVSHPRVAFPLLPRTPIVSEVLSWLGNHPKLQNQIEIVNLSYRMVEFPTLRKKKKTYRAEVELEFVAENPANARAFHDILTQESAFIDTKAGIKWQTERGQYRAKFFLTDRTHYKR